MSGLISDDLADVYSSTSGPLDSDGESNSESGLCSPPSAYTKQHIAS